MVGDGGSSLLLAALAGLAQDFGGAAMQAGTPASREAVVEVADQQGVPEVVGDARAAALFGEHAGLQRFLQQVEDGVFVGVGAARLPGADLFELEGASHNGAAPKPPLHAAA